MAREHADEAREGELVNDLPPNVTPLHGKRDETNEHEEQGRRKSKEEIEQKKMDERAALVHLHAQKKEEEYKAEGHAYAIARYALSDMGNAARLQHHFGDRLRYVAPWNEWLYHDDVRWRKDTTCRIDAFAMETVELIPLEILLTDDIMEKLAIYAHYEKSQTSGRISAMIRLAANKVALEPEEVRSGAERLMTGSGLVDLRTGALLPPDTPDFGLGWTPVTYGPDVPCPRWEAFLLDVMNGDKEMVAFLQRLAGYCATGLSREQKMFFFGKTPRSGKGAFLRTLQRALGDYAIALNIDFLNKTTRGFNEHSTVIAQLFGVRLGIISELAQGDKLNEQRFKVLTGGDPLRARYMRQNFFGFDPTHTLILQTNYYPVIESMDQGTWSRIVVVPWTKAHVEPEHAHLSPELPVVDRTLEPALHGEELPGILAWIVRGAVAYLEGGLQILQAVHDATQEYREEQDTTTPFRLACIIPAPPDTRTSVTAVYDAYVRFCAGRKEAPLPMNVFGQRMRLYYTAKHFETGNFYLGIKLKEQPEGAEGGSEEGAGDSEA